MGSQWTVGNRKYVGVTQVVKCVFILGHGNTDVERGGRRTVMLSQRIGHIGLS